MWDTFYADRANLANKYHKTSEPFNAFNRMAYHGYDYDPATGFSDAEMRSGLEDLAGLIRELPHPVAKAHAVAYVLEHTRIDVNAQDYFVGLYSWSRVANAITISRWVDEVFTSHIPAAATFMKKHKRAGTVDMWVDYDHSVPDWQALIRLGFPGIRERARVYRQRQAALTPEQAAYFAAIEIEYTAILDLIERLRQYALTRTHAKAPAVAACLQRLHDGPPQNTYDVLQLIYLYFMICESVESYQVRSLGNGLDAAIAPFYRQDLASGAFGKEELDVYLAYFLMQFSAIGNYWGQPFYLGGTGPQGETLYNEASYAILDVYDRINIYNPKVQLKINTNTPRQLLEKVLDMIRSGRSSFVFLCEPGIMRAMMGLGMTEEEARTCDIKGCYEFAVRAGEVSTAPLYLNLLKPVSLVLNNGADPITGETVGLRTGDLDDLATFDDFYQAYLKQLAYILDSAMQVADQFEQYLEFINPSPMFSATIEHSLQTMQDAYASGSKYNNTVVLHTGFASAVDSLMAVKNLVYDDQKTSLAELRQALHANWQGHDRLRLQAIRCPHQFGNNDETADRYATALSRWLCLKENLRPNARGGFYKAAMHSARHYLTFGPLTEATPDGRQIGDELSKNISPAMGRDKNGVTALVHSVTKLDPSLYTEDFCLDVMLHPSATSGSEGLSAMKAVLDTYMAGHGLAIQFNVFDTQTLRDAQAHPEKYSNLQVRVCGWNVLWHNLSRAEQEAYILRCENIR